MQHSRFVAGLGRAACGLCVLAAAVLVAMSAAVADDREFPFDSEFLLDVEPMQGSKRVPGMDIAGNGTATVDLWCNSVQAQLIVAGDTVTILTGALTARECPPERVQGDEDMLAALAQVTTWRRDGHILILSGPRTLRFRKQTN
jgi:heat shock protein HslJ